MSDLKLHRVRKGRNKGRWVIVGLPFPDCRYCGPYDRKQEAEHDRVGLAKFLRQYKPRSKESP